MDDDVEFERVCAILGSIAQTYAPDSAESLAIRDAAIAYHLVHGNEGLKQSYRQFRDEFNGELTDEMKANLRRLGIDPDVLPDV